MKELILDPAELEVLRKSRYDVKIPPGFRDKSKDDGGVGDLAIWLTILQVAHERESDALFVSDDIKDDWYHRSGDDALFPRYELREEFSYYTEGRSFGLSSLSMLLESYGATEQVIREVKEHERLDLSSLWPKRTSPLESIVVNEIVRRLHATSPDVPVVVDAGYPDIIASRGGETVGFDVGIFGDASAPHAYSHSRIVQDLERAGAMRYSKGLADVALVIGAATPAIATQIAEWFLEKRFQTMGVSIVIGHVDSLSFTIVHVESRHPLIARAFRGDAA